MSDNKRQRCITVSFVFLILLASCKSMATVPGLQPAKSWDLNGYVKYMISATFPDNEEDLVDHLIHQRFNFEYRLNSNIRFNAAMRNRFIWGDTAKNPVYSDYIGLDSGYIDLSKNWNDGDNTVGNSQLDRLYIDWNKGNWQLRGGRFRINWGMTTVWNPNDVFNSYSVYDFDYEERPGTDAVLVSKKLGFASNLDFVYSPNDDSELNSYALRHLFNTKGWDIQLIGGKAKIDNFVGAGIAGDIKGAGDRKSVV